MNQALLDLIYHRAGGFCEYCHFPAELGWLPFQVDHIIAEKHGGQPEEDNLALSCFYCNSFKGPNIAGIDPNGKLDQAVQLFHPRQQVWAEHFQWQGARLIGLTPSGRATIAVLRMNSAEAIEFREILFESGYEPRT